MKILWGAVAIVTAVIVQVLVSGIWPPMARFFDLPLIPVLYYAIAKGPSGALLVGTGAGLLQDSLEGTLLGVSAMSKALVGYLVGIMGLRFSLVPLASRIVAVAVASPWGRTSRNASASTTSRV